MKVKSITSGNQLGGASVHLLIFRSSRRVYPLFVYIFTGSGISCHVVSVDECRCIGCAIGHTHSSRQCETNRASSYSKIQTKAAQHLEPNARSRRLCVLSSPVERKRFNSLVQETYIGKKISPHLSYSRYLYDGFVRW